MATGPNTNTENPDKKTSVSEAIESVIEKKKAEKETVESSEVREAAAGTSEGVAEVLAGVDKPNEKPSEKKGETGEKGDISHTTTGDDEDAAELRDSLGEVHLPAPEIMIKKVRTAIKKEIQDEIKKARALRKTLDTGGAQEYNESIARIRKLTDVLSNLFNATVDILKSMYLKYFTTTGEKRQDEL